MKCTICGSSNVTRSHWRGIEKISRYIIPRTPYRCKECWSRFWVFENPFRNRAAKIAGFCIVCLLIPGLVWHFWPRKEETSWQAVQKNVRAVPESGPQKSAKVKSPPDLQVQTDVKTEGTEGKSVRIPAPPMAVPENGKAEMPVIADRSGTPASDAGVIPIPPIPVAVSKPASESGNKEEFPASPGKGEEGESLPGSGTKGGETEISPEKKTETDSASHPAVPETAKALTDASDAATIAPAGSETPHKIRAEHTEKAASSDAGSLRLGKPETFQDTVSAGSVPEPGPAAKTVSATVPFRELRTVKTESGKDAFEVHILADGPVQQHTFFHLKSPPKLVVDLPGKWKHRGDALFKVRDSMVSQVRVGQHPDFIRVVLDLKISRPVQPVFSETEQGLKVTLRPKAE